MAYKFRLLNYTNYALLDHRNHVQNITTKHIVLLKVFCKMHYDTNEEINRDCFLLKKSSKKRCRLFLSIVIN